MRHPRSSPLLLLGTLALIPGAVQDVAAQSARSAVLGATVINLAPAENGVPKITTFSPNLRLTVGEGFQGKSRGTLTAVAAGSLQDSSANWAPGSLAASAAPYAVQITSGSGAGTWWTVLTSLANDASTVHVASNRAVTPLTAGVQAGDGYAIVPVDTLETLFAGIESEIGGGSATTADAVRLHDGSSWREFHFNTAAQEWREGTSTRNRSATAVRPDSGVVFLRRRTTPATLILSGRVADSSERQVVGGTGVTVLGNVHPVPRTLRQFNLHTANGWVPSSGGIGSADRVAVFDGVNWRTFTYSSPHSQWREGTSSRDRSDFSVLIGAPLIVERTASATSPLVVIQTVPYSP